MRRACLEAPRGGGRRPLAEEHERRHRGRKSAGPPHGGIEEAPGEGRAMPGFKGKLSDEESLRWASLIQPDPQRAASP